MRGIPLYQIDTLVDLINLVSLRTGHSIGGFDTDKIQGTHLELGIGKAGEPFEGIGRGVLNIEGLPVYRDSFGGIGTPTSDHERTKMDHNLIEAAQDLGASPTRVFGKVILPLSMPGVMSGIVMVFMPTVSTFAIAELLTMNNIKLFGTTVQENIYNGMWNYGAALSLIMLLLIGITILFTNEEDGASNESGGVI